MQAFNEVAQNQKYVSQKSSVRITLMDSLLLSRACTAAEPHPPCPTLLSLSEQLGSARALEREAMSGTAVLYGPEGYPGPMQIPSSRLGDRVRISSFSATPRETKGRKEEGRGQRRKERGERREERIDGGDS